MILVTGAAGQLGSDVVAELKKRGIACTGIDRNDCDITDPDAVHGHRIYFFKYYSKATLFKE